MLSIWAVKKTKRSLTNPTSLTSFTAGRWHILEFTAVTLSKNACLSVCSLHTTNELHTALAEYTVCASHVSDCTGAFARVDPQSRSVDNINNLLQLKVFDLNFDMRGKKYLQQNTQTSCAALITVYDIVLLIWNCKVKQLKTQNHFPGLCNAFERNVNKILNWYKWKLKILLHQFHIWMSEKGLQCIKTKKHPGHLAELRLTQ